MKRKKNLFIVIISIVIIILIAMLVSRTLSIAKIQKENTSYSAILKDQDEKLGMYEYEIETLTKSINVLKEEKGLLEETSKLLENANTELISKINELNTISYSDEWELNKAGIEDFNIIVEDLYEHPELLPYEGVLGGTMSFGPVNLINSRWVYAKFSDGHIAGYGLYEFDINEEKEIFWRYIIGNLYGEE